MSDDFPFKTATLLEQCGGNRDIGEVILDEFLVQIAADTKEIEGCFANNDIVQIGKVGHRLKGTASVLGATKLHLLCSALETAGKSENAAEAARIYSELKTEAERCAAAVPEARNRL